MFNQRSIIVIFIDRNTFQLFGGTLTGVVSLDVPETVIRDLEVQSQDSLYLLIKQWVKQYSLSGYQLVYVLSESTYFEKLFSLKEQSQIESDVLKFFDMVPYESIWTKVYTTEKGKRAVAINKAFYDAIHQGFSLQGLQTKTVIPLFALGDMGKQKKLDAAMGEYVIKNLDSLMKQSLMDSQELSAPVMQRESEESSGSTKKKSQLPMLLGVFGVLILILIIVIALQYR